MKILDYIFYRIYYYCKHYDDKETALTGSIMLVCFICDRILYPGYESLQLLILGRNNFSFWQDLIIESPILIYLTYRYIKNKEKILNSFAHHKYSKTSSFIFIFSVLFGTIIISLNLAIYLDNLIKRKELEGTWNIPEFFRTFVGE